MKNYLKEKKIAIGLLSTLFVSSCGGVVSFAAEYPSPTKAKTDAAITFEKGEDPDKPVDPEDPDKPVDPVDPINPNGDELMLTYVSNFNFGSQKKTDSKWQALADRVYTDTSKSDTREVVPFVATKDVRGTDRKGWVITARLESAFKDSNGNELKGAEMNLSNMNYIKEEGAPLIVNEKVTLSTEAQEISKATSENGVGNWSLALGQLQGTEGSKTTNGVELNVPTTSTKNATTYKTSIIWELTADPTA
ncbi:WxL domain-containing protein [Enterococcus faecalis]|uniref:WxL domain-containing protein n=1 Tax=Enterococcus faecalis TaxID=1351 RepID=UPI001F59BB5B|nr:WxL domain-containing protein [Enterococcus faecalis]